MKGGYERIVMIVRDMFGVKLEFGCGVLYVMILEDNIIGVYIVSNFFIVFVGVIGGVDV